MKSRVPMMYATGSAFSAPLNELTVARELVRLERAARVDEQLHAIGAEHMSEEKLRVESR